MIHQLHERQPRLGQMVRQPPDAAEGAVDVFGALLAVEQHDSEGDLIERGMQCREFVLGGGVGAVSFGFPPQGLLRAQVQGTRDDCENRQRDREREQRSRGDRVQVREGHRCDLRQYPSFNGTRRRNCGCPPPGAVSPR